MKESNADPCCGSAAAHPAPLSRRTFFARLSITLGAVCAAVLSVPVLGFIVAPLFRKTKDQWIPVGNIDDFKIGTTTNVPFPDPSPLPWAGITAKGAAWLRRESAANFTAFSVNCTHMGCPVRWLQEAQLFMCPCHGGVYYKDGTVAAGPPPKPLVRYEVRVSGGRVEIKFAAIPITTSV